MSKPRLVALAAFTLALPLALSACSSKCCARRTAAAPAPAAPAAPAGGCVRPPGPAAPIDPNAPPPVPTPPPSPATPARGPEAPVAGAAAAGGPLAASEAAADKPVNIFCPVLMGEPIDPSVTTLWEGKIVGFCSVVAKQKFLKDPAKYSKNLP